jgi:hypothetical protein
VDSIDVPCVKASIAIETPSSTTYSPSSTQLWERDLLESLPPGSTVEPMVTKSSVGPVTKEKPTSKINNGETSELKERFSTTDNGKNKENVIRCSMHGECLTNPSTGMCAACENEEKYDSVERPKHYTKGSIEVWDFIVDQGLDYMEGNVVKYVCRYKHKNGLEDLKKAQAYLNKIIKGYEILEKYK